jgi:hypothetical protein
VSDHNEPPHDPAQGPAGSGPGEPVGSVGDEAAKLFAALSDLARERGSDLGGSAAAAAGHVSEAIRDADAHVGHGKDCRYCPVCQVIRVVRETSPEVKGHLAVAASSLVQAAAGVLATHVPESDGSSVEHIDLDDDSDDGGDGR